MIWPFKPRSRSGVIAKTTYFRPNDSFREIKPYEIARMAVALEKHPYERRAITDPEGAFISPKQYAALPVDLQSMFSPAEVTVYYTPN